MNENKCNIIIKKYLNHKNILKYPLNNKYFSNFYKDCSSSFNYIKSLNIMQDTNHKITKLPPASKFFSPKCRKDIINNMTYRQTYECCINKIILNINFYNYKKRNFEEHLMYMLTWLHMATIKNKYQKNIKINIYMCKLKKLDTDVILGPNNINSGFTSDREITVYREEEWFKVFVHETFHNLNLDFCSYPDKKLFYLNDLYFNVKQVKLYEAYSETWARILNSLFCAYKYTSNKKDFLLKANLYIQVERYYSQFQAYKLITKYNGFKNYYDFDNIYVYYVISSLFMDDYIDFMKWCEAHNKQSIYNIDNKMVISFVRYTQVCLKKSFSFIFTPKMIGPTLRMTIIDLL